MRKIIEWGLALLFAYAIIKGNLEERRANRVTHTKEESSPANAEPSTVQRPADEQQNASMRTAETSSGPDVATRTLKKLQPKLPKLTRAVEAYVLALESSSSSAESIISKLTAFVSSAETKRAIASDPVGTQQNINAVCSKCYDAFHKQANRNWEILEDSRAMSLCSEASAAVNIQPESDTKVVLSRIVENCDKARQILNRYRLTRKFEVAEQMQQINQARSDFPPLAQEMRAELELLKTLNQTIDKL